MPVIGCLFTIDLDSVINSFCSVHPSSPFFTLLRGLTKFFSEVLPQKSQQILIFFVPNASLGSEGALRRATTLGRWSNKTAALEDTGVNHSGIGGGVSKLSPTSPPPFVDYPLHTTTNITNRGRGQKRVSCAPEID